MFLPLAVILGAMLFAIQLVMCLKCKKRWMKWMPMILIALGELVCWGIVWLSEYRAMPYGAAFAAYIYAVILLMFLGFAILAWVIYGILYAIRKRRQQKTM